LGGCVLDVLSKEEHAILACDVATLFKAGERANCPHWNCLQTRKQLMMGYSYCLMSGGALYFVCASNLPLLVVQIMLASRAAHSSEDIILQRDFIPVILSLADT